MRPPKFKFDDSLPTEARGAMNETNFRWALIERLNYMCEALYELTQREGSGESPQTQLHPDQEDQ